MYFTAYCLSIQLKKILKTKDELVTKLIKIEVSLFVIFRKKPKKNRNRNHVTLIQTERKESEELLKKYNASTTAMSSDVEEIMDQKALFNNILNSNILNSMLHDFKKTVIITILKIQRVFD